MYQIMKHIRNFFHIEGAGKSGLWVIEDGSINLPFMKENQYFQIEGSIFNDGVYKYPVDVLTDESFVGYIAPLAVPPDFIALCDEIKAWQELHANDVSGAYQSESFGGYSYTRATDRNGNAVGWQDVFRKRLNAWRKV